MSETDITVRRAMRLLVARCEVLYTGRLTARLPEAVRLLMFKADGSFLVHDDARGFRPLNCIRTEFRPRDRFGPQALGLRFGDDLASSDRRVEPQSSRGPRRITRAAGVRQQR